MPKRFLLVVACAFACAFAPAPPPRSGVAEAVVNGFGAGPSGVRRRLLEELLPLALRSSKARALACLRGEKDPAAWLGTRLRAEEAALEAAAKKKQPHNYDAMYRDRTIAHYLEWLEQQYLAHGWAHKALELALRRFDQQPGVPTYAAVKAAVHRLRQRYRVLLRETIAETVGSEAEVEEELRYLLKIVAGG